MNDFNEKTLKLLADPHKLLRKKRIIVYDKFKTELQYKFRYDIDDILYKHLIHLITQEIAIYSVMDGILTRIDYISNNSSP